MTPTHGYSGTSQPLAADGSFEEYTRAAKRRRLGEGTATWNEPPQRRPEEPEPQFSAAGAPYGGAIVSAVHGESSDVPPQQWSSDAYPEVASYSQPYFYQAAVPSTYTSSWAAAGASASGGTYPSTATYNAGGEMPFFPTSTSELEGFSTAATYQNVPQANTEQQYASYTEQQPTAPSGSTLYLEDASMHLKLQSLPILDKLVSCRCRFDEAAAYAHRQRQSIMSGR